MSAAAQPQTAAGGFVVGPENSLVRELAHGVISERLLYNPLVLVGPSGVGKSTLAGLLADRRRSALGLAHCLETSGADLARALAHAAETNSVADLRTRHQRCDLLLIDDVQQLAGRAAAQQFLVTTLDVLVRRGVLIVATLPQLPQMTEGLLPALASRLNAGLIVPLAPPAELARREIVRQLAEQLDLRLSDELLARLAGPPRRGLSITAVGLRRTLLRLASASQHGQRPLHGSLLTEVLAGDQPEAKAVVRQLTGAVARHFDLSLSELKGKSRQQKIAEARGLAMYLARDLTDLTLAEIGKLFGNRDHSTVLHACRKIAQSAASDTATARLIEELAAQVTMQTN